MQSDYAAVKKDPTSQSAALAYATDLQELAAQEGAHTPDQAALNSALSTALAGAGVSPSNIAYAIANEGHLPF